MNMKNIVMLLVPSFAFMACKDSRVPYYDKEGVVTLSGLSVVSQEGNIGGMVLEISGSGFSSDQKAVTVMFGNQNADVLSATSGLLTVSVPHGPIGGGAVDVRVGTPDGQATLTDAYTYALPGNGLEPVYGDSERNSENQIAYVMVTNDMMSCYGGTGFGPQCGDAYTGDAGIAGRAEGLEMVYPGAEAPYALGKSGFGSDTSVSWKQWDITTTPHEVVSFDDENAVENFRLELGEFVLKNDAKSGSFCANLPSLANFYYTGEEMFVPTATNQITGELINPELEGLYLLSPTSVSGGGDLSQDLLGVNGCEEGSKAYDLSELQFCMIEEYEKGDTLSYAADWPIADNFFVTADESGRLVADRAIPVTLEIEKANISQQLNLPPYAQFQNTMEIDNPELWAAVGSLDAECPDTDGDRLTSAEDGIFDWVWTPIDWQDDCSNSDGSNGDCVEVPDGVVGVNSYVKVNVSYLALSWMGGEGVTQQATITVPDNNDFDPETGLSNLQLPSWVMYSFPSAKQGYGEQGGTQLGGPSWGGYADSTEAGYGLVILTIDRVVEFTIPASIETQIGGEEEAINGDLVFAYSTGDMGFYTFDNPLDSTDPCNDCIDNDGDGWVDSLDPDCMDGGIDENQATYLSSTCNDGIDNDEDGLIDAADQDCIDGSSGESLECSDQIDNDEDGWTDQEDPDCQGTGIFEQNDTFGTFSCNNGLDDDGDGWIDIDDPDCVDENNIPSATAEEIGFISEYGCNDGIDNDGWGDIDAEDINCYRRGASADEAPEMVAGGQCDDGLDNDEDGWIDAADPGCEMSNGNRETPESYDNTDAGYEALGDCNDGADNDCDGLIDAEDPACGNPYVNSEVEDSGENCNCGDGLDNDGDGWVDDTDLDCVDQNGDYTSFAGELGFVDADGDGVPDYACNNGLDDDGDGFTDAFDVFCWEREGADGATETPPNPGASCSNDSDDDGDGWVDINDPGCEKSNGNNEGTDSSLDFAHWGTEEAPLCLNGIDDDEDGFIDGSDPQCADWTDNDESQ